MCTTARTKKVIVGLALVASLRFFILTRVTFLYELLFFMSSLVLPVIILVINVLLIREVRRATSHNAAANLGLQQQSSSSHSAVPTVMLVTTSLVYVLLLGTSYLIYVELSVDDTWLQDLRYLVYTYNFYVYLITSKQFRSDLCTLLCHFSVSSSSSAAAAAVAYDRDGVRLQARRA